MKSYRDLCGASLRAEERGKAAKDAEVFEICEYGRRPTPAEIRTLFPLFGE